MEKYNGGMDYADCCYFTLYNQSLFYFDFLLFFFQLLPYYYFFFTYVCS